MLLKPVGVTLAAVPLMEQALGGCQVAEKRLGHHEVPLAQ